LLLLNHIGKGAQLIIVGSAVETSQETFLKSSFDGEMEA
jgi:hypothetical protein